MSRDARVRRKRVEAVDGAKDDMHLRGHASCDQALGIREVFLDKEIESAYANKSRRQAGQIGDSRGHRTIWNVSATWRHSEKGAPPESVRVSLPYHTADSAGDGAGTSGAIV